MVDAAGQRFDEIGEEYVRQIVDLSPGQRKRYLGQLQVLAKAKVRGSYPFSRTVTSIHESDIKDWLIDWERSLKTKANYHGLMHGVFAYAVKRGYLAANPALGTAPKQSRVKQSRPELRFFTEKELRTVLRLAGVHGDLLSVTVGTGLRFHDLRHTHVAWLVAGGAHCRTSRRGWAMSRSRRRSTPTATCSQPATS